MTIVGVDPGLRSTAVALYEAVRRRITGHEIWHELEGSDPERMARYCALFRGLLLREEPDLVAIETQCVSAVQAPQERRGTFQGRDLPEHIAAALVTPTGQDGAFQKRAAERGGKNTSVVRLAHLAGALEHEAALLHIRVVRILPQQAKRALTGNPNAQKRDMVRWAHLMDHDVPRSPNHNVADAYGIALAGAALLREEALSCD